MILAIFLVLQALYVIYLSKQVKQSQSLLKQHMDILEIMADNQDTFFRRLEEVRETAEEALSDGDDWQGRADSIELDITDLEDTVATIQTSLALLEDTRDA